MAGWLTSEVVAAVAHHMNNDHADDTLAMVLAARPDAVRARVVDLDYHALRVQAELVGGATVLVDLAWPGELTGRADIRRYVVELHEAAQGATGTTDDRLPMQGNRKREQ